MAPKYKLLALDMDGTLLNEESIISEENRIWMQKALDAGVTVILSTGRGVQKVYPYTDELGLTTPIVAVNGSEVWKEPRVLLKRTLIEADWIRRMHELSVKYGTWFWSYSVDGVYNSEQWTTDLEPIQWLKFGYYTENDDHRGRILDQLNEWGIFEITNSHPHNLEINPKGISKASGIEEVCKLVGISMADVVAMGDSLNDMAMIRAAGLGVAMGNAQEELKRAADMVTVTNQEHAVAKIIREHILV
ncbi:Cof-type HAD-IIB family hydrolase [Paenibacillus koleovorans]|uniref:Cof-type HAD-IIB family hydrolase n=1 Tax=Paenibacillus koleovorans TaxID=121608 RepID=UPI000FD9550D|nr:Cof-type HAD-IIB family hydrolase [Paenibacillus koleovorans]